jgi:hypothetical protein
VFIGVCRNFAGCFGIEWERINTFQFQIMGNRFPLSDFELSDPFAGTN